MTCSKPFYSVSAPSLLSRVPRIGQHLFQTESWRAVDCTSVWPIVAISGIVQILYGQSKTWLRKWGCKHVGCPHPALLHPVPSSSTT